VITATLEFYDLHGLLLHSGDYAPVRVREESDLATHHVKAQAALDVLGAKLPRCKTATLRCDVPNKIYPVTLECVNPHFEESSK